jgi:shikimate dehydrogenase
MEVYGIIGYPVKHSYSPEYFNSYFQRTGIAATYLRFEMQDLQNLPALLCEYPQLKGFNVTAPHKENILPFLDQISEEAQAIGAVNCVKIEQHPNRPYLHGYNTDVHGFQTALLDFIPPHPIKALILGNGGASKAVRYVLNQLHIEHHIVSRTPKAVREISYADSKWYLPTHQLIVNTTPLGTWPEIDNSPAIAYDLLSSKHYLFDLVYNPATTTFMKKGLEQGAHCCNGLQMLLKQAEKNIEIWRNGNYSLFSQRI